MPFVNGVFRPRPVRRHTSALFDVLPPDHPESEATQEDREWYDDLSDAVADLLVYIVQQVRLNYDNHRGVSWGRGVVFGQTKRADVIARLLDDEFSRTQVANAVNRLAKQFGLVVYSPEPGERHNWPMPGRRRFTHEDAVKIVHDAFWERWPDSV